MKNKKKIKKKKRKRKDENNKGKRSKKKKMTGLERLETRLDALLCVSVNHFIPAPSLSLSPSLIPSYRSTWREALKVEV